MLKFKTNGLTKVLAVISAFCIIFSLFAAVPFVIKAENTEKMFVISPNKSGETKYANVFVPLDFLEVDGKRLHSQESNKYYYFKLSFKLKLIDDKMPIVGIIRYAYWNNGGQSEYNYVNNNQESHADTLLYSTYDEDTLTYTALIKMWINPDPATGVHTVLTIGNMEHNNSWHKENNFGANFAFSAPELYAYDTVNNKTFGENLLPKITDSTFTGSTYKHPQNGYTGSDSVLKAPANKWSIDTTASLIALEEIPTDYFKPNPHKYTYVPAVSPTSDTIGYKAHYVCNCDECKDKYFLDKGITEVTLKELEIEAWGDDKLVIVSPNKDDEKKFANVFIPINFRDAAGVHLKGENYYFKLTFKTKLLNDKLPIVSVIRYNPYNNLGSWSEPNNSKNNQSDYSHTDEVIYSEYDEDTYTFSAVVKVWINDNYCTSPTGAYAAIMIGNAEHNDSWYSEHNFDTHFAFTQPKLYYYDKNTKEAKGDNLIPPITENTVNFDKVYQHLMNDYADVDNIMAAPANMWSIDGTKKLITIQDIPSGYFKHKYVKVPTKAPTKDSVGYKEHYICGCDECDGKYFSDKGKTEVTLKDLELPAWGEDKVVVVSPNVEGGTKFANVFIPINFRDAAGVHLKGENYYFKLTFKTRLYNEKLPIVSVIRYNPYNNLGSWSEPNNAKNNQESYSHTDEVIYSEYDEDTMTFSAVVKVWINDNYCTSPTGAYAAIMIGNAEHNDSWYSEHNFDTHFAFAEPELYYYDKNSKEAKGENLIAPITESTMNFDKAYKHIKNDYAESDNIMAAPANMWSIDGEKSFITVYDYPEDYFKPDVHEFIKHPAKEATITEQGNMTYYTCDCEHCKDKYFSDYGLTEISKEDTIITKKMIVISPNSSGGTKTANTFIPLNFRSSGGVNFNEDNYYFKLTFKLKILGNSMPIIGMIRYNPYDNKGSWSEFKNANNNQLDHDDQIIYSEYDPETMIFTAVVKTWISDKYSSSPTGAHTAITIGNMEHNNSWRSEYNFDASFAFADPKLYAYNATTGETYGENLMADINDATFNSGKVYQHLMNDYADDDNIMAAPANMWSIDGQKNMVTLSDIPKDYFVPTEGTPHLVMFTGRNNSDGEGTNGRIFQRVQLEAGKSYQVSYNAKYAGTGLEGDKLGGQLEYNTAEGFAELTAEKTKSDTEYKEIFKFTMPSDAKDGKNFRFTFNYSSAFTSGYMANFELYELDANGKTTGNNLFKNGDFSVGGISMWNKQGESYRFMVEEIPENFFSKTESIKPNMAIYRNTSDFAQIFQMPALKPNTRYEFKHIGLHTDYVSDKKPYGIVYLYYKDEKGNNVDASIPNELVEKIEDENSVTMRFTTYDTVRLKGDNNSLIRVYMRSDSAGFWSGFELYELDKDGNRIGNNLFLNPDFLFGFDAWTVQGDYNIRLAEVPDGFFENYKEPDEMVYATGEKENQTYSTTLQISADKKYYYLGEYVNMNSAGITPQIQYLDKNGQYKNYDGELFYDSSRYYFELEFEAPEDALVTDGKVFIRAQMNNTQNGKGYFTNLMLTEDGKYENLFGEFTFSDSDAFNMMPYDSGVFVFYYDDNKFDDGDWSGELTDNEFNITTGEITGMILGADGLGVQGYTMKLMPGNITTKTDEYGSYLFEDLEPGNYKLYFVENEESELYCMDIEVKRGMSSMLPLFYYTTKTIIVGGDDTSSEQEITSSEEAPSSSDEEFVSSEEAISSEEITSSQEQSVSSEEQTTSSEDTTTSQEENTTSSDWPSQDENTSTDNTESTPIVDIYVPEVQIPVVDNNYPVVEQTPMLDVPVVDEAPVINQDVVAEYGLMRGFYYTTKGKTISGATIHLRNHGSTVTDNSGMFMFENIIPGEYEVYTVLADGSEYVFRTVVIEANKGVQIKIMEPKPEKEKSGFNWVIVVIIVASVLALAGIAAATIILIKKKKVVKF